MKLLFVAQNDFLGDDNNGGIAITRRNYSVLCTLIGRENIDTVMIAPNNNTKGFKTNKNVKWIEGNIRGLKNVLNEIFNYTYVTAKGEKQLFSILNSVDYDIVWLDSTHFGTLAKKIKKRIDTKIISYAYDFESEYMKMYCNPSLGQPHYYLKMHRVRQNERDALFCSDRFICISERDRESYLIKYSHDVDLVMPVTFNDVYDGSNELLNEPPFLLFVGSYFLPNVEGITWFANHVAGLIDMDVKVVGRGMEQIDSTLFPDNVKIIGAVDDLSKYYKSAFAVIMPIFSGSGMKVKTAEAMMYGKMIIASDEALVGYSVDNIPEIYRCNTVEEFVDAISIASKSEKYYNETVRAYYLENCETNGLVIKLKQCLKGLVEELHES